MTPAEIIAGVENGVYVARLGGGQVDTGSGDFVFGMTEAYLIENGEITSPLREGQLIGNGPKVLESIQMVGNDLEIDEGGWTCGKDGESVPVLRNVNSVVYLTVGTRDLSKQGWNAFFDNPPVVKHHNPMHRRDG